MLVLVVAMILAGFWQLDRRQEKRDRNALITERQDEPVAPVEEIVSVDDPTSVGRRGPVPAGHGHGHL